MLLALRTSGILCGRWVKWVASIIEEHVLTVVLGRKEVLAPLRCARPALRLRLWLVAASSLRSRSVLERNFLASCGEGMPFCIRMDPLSPHLRAEEVLPTLRFSHGRQVCGVAFITAAHTPPRHEAPQDETPLW